MNKKYTIIDETSEFTQTQHNELIKRGMVRNFRNEYIKNNPPPKKPIENGRPNPNNIDYLISLYQWSKRSDRAVKKYAQSIGYTEDE